LKEDEKKEWFIAAAAVLFVPFLVSIAIASVLRDTLMVFVSVATLATFELGLLGGYVLRLILDKPQSTPERKKP
jgi:putative effector of murein hydrolase LrgA (UPF0299 family)